jgi:dienelactone hydrolase
MKTQAIRVKLRDGEMGAYLAIPNRTPAGAIIAIMEIWHSRTQRDLTERTCTQERSDL